MIIKKFIGKTEKEATQKAKEELGNSCVVMNVRELKPSGFFKAFKSSSYEVTVAIEQKDTKINIEEAKQAQNSMQNRGKINLEANEEINLSAPAKVNNGIPGNYSRTDFKTQTHGVKAEAKEMLPEKKVYNEFEERLDNLQSMLEEKLSESYAQNDKSERAEISPDMINLPTKEELSREKRENVKMVRMLYNTLLDNELSEKYINMLFDEMDKSISNSSNIDVLLSNVYQKMILKFGKPSPIDLTGPKPKVIFFIGPTGVGKTTTIAKIASKLRVEAGRRIALLTADTYRIAAEEQLRTYANILDTPLSIIYSPDELNEAIEKTKDVDVILVDTAGFSHKSQKQKMDTKELIDSVSSDLDVDVYLVLSATTKYRDLMEIADSYKEIADYKLIFTKLDETSCFGNLYNIKMYTQADMSYVTTGQNVPEDIEVFDTQAVVKKLLGGN